MKLASYRLDGEDTFGAVVGDGVVTLGGGKGRWRTLRDALAADALGELKAAIAGKAPDHKLAQITFLPVIPNPEKILCVGINYRDHAAETGRDTMSNPQIFLRLVNTLVGHEGEMIRPKVSTNFDFEGELTAIIGKGGRHIKESDALGHVAGYTCFVDGSVRDWQKHAVDVGQELHRHRPARPLDGDDRRDPRPDQAHADDPPQRGGDAALRHRHADLLGGAHHLLRVRLHAARAGRRDRHRHARRRRPPPQSAGVDEGRRRARGGDHRHRHAAQPDRG